jgi:mannose-6-phosphate isomerase-like protein (cupin superfamily)
MTGALSDGPRSGRRDLLELSDDPPQTVARLAPRGRLSPLVKAVRVAKKIRRDHHRAEHWLVVRGTARVTVGAIKRQNSTK